MKKFLLYILLVTSCISCDNNSDMEKTLEILSHDNGLTIEVNEGHKVTNTLNGFKFNLSGDDSRSINELEIKKVTNSSFDLSNYEEHYIDGVTYYSKLESVSEGSGGEEYTLRIWKPFDNGEGILLEHYIQQEPQPSFDQDWDIVISAR